MSDVVKENPVPVWACEFASLPNGEDLKALTVGVPFSLHCHGDIAVDGWDPKVLPQVQFKEEADAYSLVILKVDSLTSQDAQFVVTGYKPGDHQPEFMRILQNGKGFESAQPKWAIRSVLQPNQKTEPFAPFGPFRLSLPLWFWLVLIVLLTALVASVVRGLRRRVQRRRMLEEIRRHRTPLSPLHQFYKDARGLQRRSYSVRQGDDMRSLVAELNREFRLYVLRQFEIPTLEWTDSAILKDLRARHRPVYNLARDPLKKTLRELVRMQSQVSVESADFEQLQRMSLDAAERLDGARAGLR